MLQIHAIPGVLYHNFCVWSMLYGFSMLYLFTGDLDTESAIWTDTYFQWEFTFIISAWPKVWDTPTAKICTESAISQDTLVGLT